MARAGVTDHGTKLRQYAHGLHGAQEIGEVMKLWMWGLVAVGLYIVWKQMEVTPLPMRSGVPVGSDNSGGSLTIKFGNGWTASGKFDSGGHADNQGCVFVPGSPGMLDGRMACP